jgi:hypothetical protein
MNERLLARPCGGARRLVVVALVLAGCTRTGSPASPEAGSPDAWSPTRVPGRSIARLTVTPARVVLLEETLTGFDQVTPGPRTVRAIDRRSAMELDWQPDASVRIADAVVHPSGAVSVAIVDAQNRISIIGLGADLVPRTTLLLVDAQVALDPPADPTGQPDLQANGATGESVRIGALGDDVVVAAFTSRNSVVAYRLHLGDAGFQLIWRSLVEPPVGLTPFIPIGGSFDTFTAIVAWFRPYLATDADGNSYLALWTNPRRIAAHTQAFGDSLMPLPTDPGGHDSDVTITKLDRNGTRMWSRVVGTRFEDEPYALAASANEVVVAGRSRRNPGFDNSQWDPWLAALDGGGALLASRTMPFDASGIVLAVDVDGTGAITAGGSDGWTQNPDGLSILNFGAKLLFTMPSATGAPTRVAVPAGPRHNEIRSVAIGPEGAWYAGHEDGPLTHSGDGDQSQIRSTGVVDVAAVAP